MIELFPPTVVGDAAVSADLERQCENCRQPFKQREKSGGKLQRFCTPKCRYDFHAQRGQRTSPHVGDEDCGVSDPAAPPKPTVEPPQVKGTDFSWTNEEAVVLREQRQTAIYWNPDGDLVIRQRADWDEENDPYLVIGANNLQDFIDAICDMAGIGSAGCREPSSRS
jgi:hypothetical protein